METKQADPASILLPLSEYATPVPEKVTCKWINDKGVRVGELCGRICSFNKDFCSAHTLCAMRREEVGLKPSIESDEDSEYEESDVEEIPIYAQKKVEVIQEPIVQEKIEEVVQDTTVRLKKLELLGFIIKSLRYL